MKKSLKADLVSIAHKILQVKDDASYAKLTNEARALYEKLAVLAYAEQLEQQGRSEINVTEVEDKMDFVEVVHEESTHEEIQTTKEEAREPVDAMSEEQDTTINKVKTPLEIAAENEARFKKARATDKHRPDGTEYNTEAPVHEPVIEKIKDMWPEMMPDAAAIDEVIETIIPPSPTGKNDMFEIGGEYAQMPIFEPVTTTEDAAPKNLNDRLKSSLKIGLNDKIAFISHLFGGSDTDYNRVLSQLETFSTADEAFQFVAKMVKPDYNNWEGKEVYEERFLQTIANKFD